MIPNIFHFIFITEEGVGAKRLSLSHYLAVKSAVVVNKPETAYFHFNTEPVGEWWQEIKKLITPHQITAPDNFAGRQLYHVAHKSDVIRLQTLNQYGGIYLDLDTISVKPLTSLLSHRFVLGKELKLPYTPKNARQRFKFYLRKKSGLAGKLSEAVSGICSAVILAEKESAFGTLWLDSYKTFRSTGRDKYWNEHSGIVSYQLALQHPELVTLLGPTTFHYPLYNAEGLKKMFEEVNAFPEAYLHHLWESFSWDQYLEKLTVEDIRNKNTTYNLIARQFV
jgi:Glycosyltransferase sugar-binding region containing DXD motif